VESAQGPHPSGHVLATELKQEQIEVVSPPQTSLDGVLESIREGRALADAAAARVGARVVALATSPWPVASELVPEARYERIAHAFGITAAEQLTCGFHVHVGIESTEEGVAALDRVRVWLPVILALSSNSPFWMGVDTGFASYRYQAWGRWPTSGPTEVFGSAAAYLRHCEDALGSGVPLDDGMLYFDARLSSRYPTLEVRMADVCLSPEHAAVIATLVRALVDTCITQWEEGREPPSVSASLLRAWSWRASRYGLADGLVNPLTGVVEPAPEVARHLVRFVSAALVRDGELEPVQMVVDDLLDAGSGAERQRSYRSSTRRTRRPADLRGVIEQGLVATHGLPQRRLGAGA
jgi:carboxylate-amine ligase